MPLFFSSKLQNCRLNVRENCFA
uniref:Uncharacterized protein n=1 Tax=Rhizophora mucronata TaxID=61149 RepID=A0A2P2PGP5_RHIMU